MAGTANAGALVTVNGEINPESVTISVNDTLNIGLWGDGSVKVGMSYILGLGIGSEAMLDISTVNILYTGMYKGIGWFGEDYIWASDILNIQNPFIVAEFSDPVMPPATPVSMDCQLFEDVWLSPTNSGLITLRLFNGDGEPEDAQLIDVMQIYVTSVPEPATLIIMSIGALFISLRRKP